MGHEWADHIESLKCILAEENTYVGYSKTDLVNEGFSCSALTKVWIDVWDDNEATVADDSSGSYDQYTETYATEQMCYKCTCACPNEVMEEDEDGNYISKIVCAKYSSCADWNANAVDTKPKNYTWTEHTVDGLCSGSTCYLKGEYCSGGRSVSSNGKSCVCPSSTPLWDGSSCRKACSKDVSYCSAYDSSYDDCNCSACNTGYMLIIDVSSGKYTCKEMKKLCPKDIEHCVDYSSKYDDCVCTECEENYLLNVAGTQCIRQACDASKTLSCAKWSSPYEPCECTECIDGYTLTTDLFTGEKMCSEEILRDGCYRCGSKGAIYLNYASCASSCALTCQASACAIDCQVAHCASCKSGSSTTCTLCDTGYTLTTYGNCELSSETTCWACGSSTTLAPVQYTTEKECSRQCLTACSEVVCLKDSL